MGDCKGRLLFLTAVGGRVGTVRPFKVLFREKLSIGMFCALVRWRRMLFGMRKLPREEKLPR